MFAHSLDRKLTRLFTLVFFALVFLCANQVTAETTEADFEAYKKTVQPLLQKYCYECHGPNRQREGIGLHKYESLASIIRDDKTWTKVIEILEFGAMPPDDKPRPSDKEYALILRWAKSALDNRDCNNATDPGRVTIRRLNRTEYNNTIRDLLGIDIDPAKDFPSDDVGEGFDNQGDVLSISPLLLEKYVDAAERIAREAIVVPGIDAAARQVRQRKQLKASGSARAGYNGGFAMPSTGAVSAEFTFSRPGEYVLRLRSGADQAGGELAKARLSLNGRDVKTIDIDATRDNPKEYDSVTTIKKSEKQRFSAAFINDYYKPDAPNPKDRDRNLYIYSLEVLGPINLRPDEFPASHKQLLTVSPNEKRSVLQASRDVLEPFIERAFRRPSSSDEIDKYVKLVQQTVARGEKYERGIQVAVTAILVSPHFLFRVEDDTAPNDSKSIRSLNDFELASRLSYFLWSTMPDESLFEAARSGKLHEKEVLATQVRRMLRDPRSISLSEDFATQWLNLRNLDEMTPDPDVFGKFDPQLRRDMRRETELFFQSVVREDRSVLDFVSGDFTFLNERLAKHYNIDDFRSKDFERYEFGDVQRAGVLTHASVLMLTSNPNRTSPVKRGKWIMENILGTSPPDPPANVPELSETRKSNPNASMREQLEIHRKNPTCASCHRQMDPLGFGFENFDALGRWRTQDEEQEIDASGVLPSGEKFSGPRELVGILSRRKREFCDTLAKRLMVYALGRGLKFYDECAVDKIVEEMEKEDYRFSSLVTGIVLSDPFLMRRGEGEK